MVRFARAYPLLFLAIFVLAISCTIIQDSDITTPSEFANRKLKSITIQQETVKGNKTTQIQLLYDSVQNLVDINTGTKIVRRIGFSLQDFGNLKMKLRSNTTGDLEFFVSYKEGNQPYTFGILKGDSVVEIIRFRYDTSNKLNKILTIINPIDNLPAKVFTNDTLIYTLSNISRIIRRSSDASKEATIDIQYGGSGDFQTISNFSYLGFQYTQQGGACPQGQNSDSCFGYALQPSSGGGSENQSQYAIFNTVQFNTFTQIQLADVKINAGPSGSRDYDTFYFHPLMILRDEFDQGKFLLGIYSIDWLELGTLLSSTNFTQNETVNINFNYGF